MSPFNKHNVSAREARTTDGITFDSRLKMRVYQRLELLKRAGEVDYFLRQVGIHLPGGGRYVVDFLVFWSDGRIQYVDAKGMETPTFKMKKKMTEALYPITISLWRH